jgi:hypothetical protein
VWRGDFGRVGVHPWLELSLGGAALALGKTWSSRRRPAARPRP